MNRIPVTSTNVASVGYDSKSQTLEVEYQNSTIYQYYDVPETVYEELTKAQSVGSFLNAQVKPVFRYARL